MRALGALALSLLGAAALYAGAIALANYSRIGV
jgi:hypothetical protein